MSGPMLHFDVASADASFRRYFRISTRGSSLIAMDSPPEVESLERFINIAERLRQAGINAPQVLACDLARGFALLSDLGQTTYLQALREREAEADRLYGDAIRVLVAMQTRLAADDLPAYDGPFLRTELGIFPEWLVQRHLGLTLSADDERHWARTIDVLVRSALAQPLVFVHRDYHSRNLMLGAGGAPGVLDFQDAVRGPLSYDLVSLLRDCYITWSPARVQRWVGVYLDLIAQTPLAAGVPDRRAFMRSFDLMGVQRHLKAAGIFARLAHRDGKDGYLADIPRTLEHILGVDDRDTELAWLHGFLRERVVPALTAP
jgi:hypothetical protein